MLVCDPSTAILEVAVHKGFQALDGARHVLTEISITDLQSIHTVALEDISNPAWLQSEMPGAGQQRFGDALLTRYKFVLMPSVVSPESWNVIFVSAAAAGAYGIKSQRVFALDTRVNPPPR